MSASTTRNKSDSESDDKPKKPTTIRNTTDLQRLKLERLMQNPVSGRFLLVVLVVVVTFV